MTDLPRWLADAFGDSADGLCVVDHLQRIVGWNKGAERLLGFAAAEVLHRACHEVIAGCGRNGQPVCGPDCSVHRCVERGGCPTAWRSRSAPRTGARSGCISV
jgi:PAS domain-containing protein